MISRHLDFFVSSLSDIDRIVVAEEIICDMGPVGSRDSILFTRNEDK